jgi:3-methyladenine DNA glycosylase AlkD
MTFAEVMSTLESLGTEQNRKTYQRHGSGPNVFGVSFANLGKLQKKIKHDHALAEQLWATGNTDARALATMIADPAQMKSADFARWIDGLNGYGQVHLLATNVASKSPDAFKIAERWMKSKDEYVGQAGWTVLSIMAMRDGTLPDSYLEERLEYIERNIQSAKNRTKYAMNSAVIAIGMRNPKLKKLAIASAKRIGKVEVDHGDTNCKTPDAVAYIQKAAARKASA